MQLFGQYSHSTLVISQMNYTLPYLQGFWISSGRIQLIKRKVLMTQQRLKFCPSSSKSSAAILLVPSLHLSFSLTEAWSDKHGGWNWLKRAMKVLLRRWIILVLLLMISVTFLFLQILSLKAIDNTVISLLTLRLINLTSFAFMPIEIWLSLIFFFILCTLC